MKELLFNFILLVIINSGYTKLIIHSRTLTSSLEEYVSYRNVEYMQVVVPEDTILASFKFTASETKNSIYSCKPRSVSLYMKHGGPPVINPDGSKFPDSFKNISRCSSYNLQIITNNQQKFIRIISPDPGSYHIIAFLAYRDPRFKEITQQGLNADCNATVTVTLSVEKVEDPKTITEDTIVKSDVVVPESRYYKIIVPSLNIHAVLYISDIHFPANASTLTVRTEANKPPSARSFNKQEVIYAHVKSSIILFGTNPDSWHYIEFIFDGTYTSSGSLTFQIKFNSEVLPHISQYSNSLQGENYVIRQYHNYKITDLIPYKYFSLARDGKSDTSWFSFGLGEDELDKNVSVTISNFHFTVLKFKIREVIDSGGTLQFSLSFNPGTRSKKKDVTVVGCLRREGIELPTWPDKCVYNNIPRRSLFILTKNNTNSTILIPYPESGVWFVTFKLFCGTCQPCYCLKNCEDQYKDCVVHCELISSEFNCQEKCRTEILKSNECKGCNCEGPCLSNARNVCTIKALIEIYSYPCVFAQCSTNGNCTFIQSDGIVLSTCVCTNYYRGWDCSDDSLATPFYMVVIEVLLLVLSNLAFLPIVYIAYKREYYIEAITYFSLFIFSCFYHACDAGENRFNYCLFQLPVLQFGDFFCALLAIWVTLIAIADISQLLKSICHIVGAIFLAFCTNVDRTNVFASVFPTICGILIITSSWIIKKRKFGQIFDDNRLYLYYFLPIGSLLVLIGVILYAFFETENNYKYVHSTWHIIIAAGLIVLLPMRSTFFPSKS